MGSEAESNEKASSNSDRINSGEKISKEGDKKYSYAAG
jgi:hypothetical protein